MIKKDDESAAHHPFLYQQTKRAPCSLGGEGALRPKCNQLITCFFNSVVAVRSAPSRSCRHGCNNCHSRLSANKTWWF